MARQHRRQLQLYREGTGCNQSQSAVLFHRQPAHGRHTRQIQCKCLCQECSQQAGNHRGPWLLRTHVAGIHRDCKSAADSRNRVQREILTQARLRTRKGRDFVSRDRAPRRSHQARGLVMRVHSKRWTRRIVGVLCGIALILGAGLPAVARVADAPAKASSRLLPPIASGDEPVVVTEHRIETARGPLLYEARTGRLAIRSAETGEVRGYIFFVAYVGKSNGPRRPITFAWNGGPTVASAIVHMEGLGPRRRTKSGVVDNAETLLADSDLVFYDALETGFSRPAKPEFAAEFLNLQGDVAATAEFIRAYRARFRTVDQPLFIAGESYGVFRANSG